MANRDNHIFADYGELMECLLKQRSRFDSEAEFRNYALATVRRFLVDLQHLGIEVDVGEVFFTHHFTAHISDSRLGN